MAVYLQDLEDLSQTCREFGGSGLQGFLTDERVAGLQWPDDVVEQWLYDHAGWGRFQSDYGHLDLARVTWDAELVAAEAFLTMPTGPSEGDLIDENAEQADHWCEVRRHLGVPQYWESHGTWMRWPVLIDRSLLYPGETGLQVIEGRTRVGILRGFLRQGRQVAPAHRVWVGRPR
ncbi:hypothetical protein [Nocardioides sp.]|uniref:hypothetical protein n=1 Tax=Nocardioides sp. TaxID=35761 RepID=UPI002ED8730F